jgi:hypothetical protein
VPVPLLITLPAAPLRTPNASRRQHTLPLPRLGPPRRSVK